MVTWWVVQTSPQMLSRQNLLNAAGAELWGGSDLLSHLSVFHWGCVGQLEWSRLKCIKGSLSPGHSCPCQLPLGHHSYCLVHDFGPNHNWDLLGVGHGRYDQQQYILIITFYTWDLQISLYNTQVWSDRTSLPSISNSLPEDGPLALKVCRTQSWYWKLKHPSWLGQWPLPVYYHRDLIWSSY